MTWDNTAPRLRGRAGQRRRRRILERDSYLCQPCLKRGVVTIAEEVDHIVPLAKGGEDTEENSQAICIPCHLDKSERDKGHVPRVGVDVDGYPKNRGEG